MRLLYLFILLPVLCSAADVSFTLTDFLSGGLTNRRVTLTPTTAPMTNGTALVIGDGRAFTADTNGQFTASNVVLGYYRVDVSGTNGRQFYISVPATNAAAVDILVAATNATAPGYALSLSASDARYLQFAGSNLVSWTSNGMKWVAASATGSGSGATLTQVTNVANAISAITSNGVYLASSNDIATLSNQVTLSLSNDIVTASNAVYRAASNDVVTVSNAVFLASSNFTVTASNGVFEASSNMTIITSNGLQLLIGSGGATNLETANITNLNFGAYHTFITGTNELELYSSIGMGPAFTVRSTATYIEDPLFPNVAGGILGTWTNGRVYNSNVTVAAITDASAKAATNSASVTNWITTRQPAHAALSNLVSNPNTTWTNTLYAVSGATLTTNADGSVGMTVSAGSAFDGNVTNLNAWQTSSVPAIVVNPLVGLTTNMFEVKSTNGFDGTANFVIDSMGRIGIGTNRPTSDLTILGDSRNLYAIQVASGPSGSSVTNSFTVTRTGNAVVGGNLTVANALTCSQGINTFGSCSIYTPSSGLFYLMPSYYGSSSYKPATNRVTGYYTSTNMSGVETGFDQANGYNFVRSYTNNTGITTATNWPLALSVGVRAVPEVLVTANSEVSVLATNGLRVSSDAWMTNGVSFPSNSVATTPTLALGEFKMWNSNGQALWCSWNTNGTVTSKVIAP